VRSFTAKPRSPALRPFVEAFHYRETELPFTLERIMPNGRAHLMVNLAEDEFKTYRLARSEQMCKHSGAVVAGPHAKSLIIDTRAQRWLAAVEFRHSGASRFFSMPMTEIANQVVLLEDVWRSNGRLMRERLLDARTPELKFRALEELLLEHLAPEFDPAMQCAVSSLRAGVPVSRIAACLGFSPRTLERRFASQVGLTPKRFARVHRLQRVLRAVRRSDTPDWCMLAVEHGYSDQAHLIHDFHDLADITPSEYKPHSPQRNNHVPMVPL
jgi:AraC-like DNA-binding protein